MSLPRISFVICVDGAPVAACMARDADDAMAYARERMFDYASLTAVPESECTPAQIEQYNAYETARCAEWGPLAKCVPFGDELVILAERLDPAP